MPALDFTTSAALTFGVELELMLVNTRDYNLAPTRTICCGARPAKRPAAS